MLESLRIRSQIELQLQVNDSGSRELDWTVCTHDECMKYRECVRRQQEYEDEKERKVYEYAEIDGNDSINLTLPFSCSPRCVVSVWWKCEWMQNERDDAANWQLHRYTIEQRETQGRDTIKWRQQRTKDKRQTENETKQGEMNRARKRKKNNSMTIYKKNKRRRPTYWSKCVLCVMCLYLLLFVLCTPLHHDADSRCHFDSRSRHLSSEGSSGGSGRRRVWCGRLNHLIHSVPHFNERRRGLKSTNETIETELSGREEKKRGRRSKSCRSGDRRICIREMFNIDWWEWGRIEHMCRRV